MTSATAPAALRILAISASLSAAEGAGAGVAAGVVVEDVLDVVDVVEVGVVATGYSLRFREGFRRSSVAQPRLMRLWMTV